MRSTFFKTLFVCFSLSVPLATFADSTWQQVDAGHAPANLQLMHPKSFLVYTMDEATLRLQLFSLSTDPASGIVISLPLPNGATRDFRVWQTPMMPDELAAKYPDIKTFTAEAVDNPSVTAKIDFTLYGFHAMIFDNQDISFVDPYDNYHDGFYMVHYKRDETRAVSERMKCMVHTHDDNGPAGESMDIAQKGLPGLAYKTVNGAQLRTYRLALACDHQYAFAATSSSAPTKAMALSKMTTSMNRINGVYERELSITMTMVAKEDTLIFVTATGDPYGADDGFANNLMEDNQTVCDARIGNTNYDMGHVFTTGGGGLSDLGIICQPGVKAKSETGGSSPVGDGFDIDYVAHEIGHEFGADHPFNNGTDGSCGGSNINAPTAYEPGSGSTIMAYAGICGPDDLQLHSDAYFHAVSLSQIQQYVTTGGDGCAVKTTTGNKLVGYAAFATAYSIPYLTPFELLAPALTDSVADTLVNYCWEEWDLGGTTGTGIEFVNTHAAGPLFRSFMPTTSRMRVFPKMSKVLLGNLNDAGTEGNEGEKVPDVARTMNFKCTFRDIIHNMGSFTFPDDEITLTAVNTGAGFAVTSQGTTGITYNGASAQTVTWNVVNTNASPISAASVDIYMSADGGNTWPYHVGTVPNTGTASITVPNPAATVTAARFKVKGNNNVFFNVNSSNFTVTHNASAPVTLGVQQTAQAANNVKVYPVPVKDMLHITSAEVMQGEVYNSIGQQVWKGQVNTQTDISVAAWAKGIYYMQLTKGSERIVKRFIVD